MAKDTINRLNQRVNDTTENIDRGVSTVGGWLGSLDAATSKFHRTKGSIIQSAKGNIFEFPVFISSSIPMEYAQATTSLLEQVYASYLQMAISINPVIDHTQAMSGVQFSSLKSDTNRYLEYTDTMWQHDTCHAIYDNEDCVVEFSLLAYENNDAAVILESVNHQPLEEFAHFFTEGKGSSPGSNTTNTNDNVDNIKKELRKSEHLRGLSQKALKEAIIKRDRYEKDLKAVQQKYDDLSESVKNGQNKREREKHLKEMKKLKQEITKNQQEITKNGQIIAKSREELKKIDQEIQLNQKKLDRSDKEKEKLDKETEKVGKEVEKLDREAKWDEEDRKLKQADLANRARLNAPKFISEKDIEKLNTMKPLLMSVEMNVRADNGTLSPVSYIVGVKTYNRIVDADTIPDVASYPLREMNKIVRKAKWRAGELKFFSDIVFHIKQKKQTAIDKKDPKRKWYRRLYELAHMKGDAPTTAIVNGGTVLGTLVADKMGRTKAAHGVIPNVSLIVSKSDVDICKTKTGIDLLNAGTASSLCNELFLMSFIVIDTDAESIKMLLPDLHNDFDVHSLASVNRQIASLDTAGKKTRDIFTMLNR